MILMLYTRLNQLHCTRHPHMLAAVHAVHTRLVRPAANLLMGGGGGGVLTAAAPAPQQLCTTYLPALQLGLGLLLPCCLVYLHERALRRCGWHWRGGASVHAMGCPACSHSMPLHTAVQVAS